MYGIIAAADPRDKLGPETKMNKLCVMLCAALSLAAQTTPPWTDLFDGKSLAGWTPAEHKSTWKVVDGLLTAGGPRSHLFYTGQAGHADFRNFELEVEAKAGAGTNSGVYFHTQYQEQGFPDKGFEVQICNTCTGEGSYVERKKTGSLYAVRNTYKQLVGDDEWFRMNVLVQGKRVQVRLNGMLVADYVEAEHPVAARGAPAARPRPRHFCAAGTRPDHQASSFALSACGRCPMRRRWSRRRNTMPSMRS